MSRPSVVICSLWRNDTDRNLVDRAKHLLFKGQHYPAVRWVWVVGDSEDATAYRLRHLAHGLPVTVLDIGDTGIAGDDMTSRLRRLSVTANHFWAHCAGADYVLIHESDIVSPPDLVARLVDHAEQGRCPIAGWPTLEIRPGHTVFYDCWAYRKDGVRFRNTRPYHQCYRAEQPFTVDSAGTVLMFDGEDAGNVLMDKQAILDVCWHLRQMGREIWVDPTLEVSQPCALWRYHEIEEAA